MYRATVPFNVIHEHLTTTMLSLPSTSRSFATVSIRFLSDFNFASTSNALLADEECVYQSSPSSNCQSSWIWPPVFVLANCDFVASLGAASFEHGNFDRKIWIPRRKSQLWFHCYWHATWSKMHCLHVNAPLFKPPISFTQHLTLIQSSVQNDGLLIKLSWVLVFIWKFNHSLTYSYTLILSLVLWSAGHLATCEHKDLWLARNWPSVSIGWLFYNWSNQSERGSDWQSLNPNQWPI